MAPSLCEQGPRYRGPPWSGPGPVPRRVFKTRGPALRVGWKVRLLRRSVTPDGAVPSTGCPAIRDGLRVGSAAKGALDMSPKPEAWGGEVHMPRWLRKALHRP